MNPIKYAAALHKALKFSDHATVQSLANQMTTADWIGSQHPASDQWKRGVLADAYLSAMDHPEAEEEAKLLHDPNQVVHWDGKRLRKGVVKVQDLGNVEDWDGDFRNRWEQNGSDPQWAMAELQRRKQPPGKGLFPLVATALEGRHFAGDQVFNHHNLGGDIFTLQRLHVLPIDRAHHDYIYKGNTTTRDEAERQEWEERQGRHMRTFNSHDYR